jgi:RimJ/RimL family protein N-acetyltransferase
VSRPYFMQSARLGIRRATVKDAAFIHTLWTMPAVMRLVGFPQGLSLSVGEIEKGIASSPNSEIGSRLIVTLLETAEQIGQCKIGVPDTDGICEPDIKLLPAYWGHGYGKELWAAMIDYAFLNSSAHIVQGTPNQANLASIKMQKGSGMIQVDKGVFPRHPGPHPGAIPVPYFKLQITRAQWLTRQRTHKGGKT